MKKLIISSVITLFTGVLIILIFLVFSMYLKTEKPGFVSAAVFSFLAIFFVTYQLPYTKWILGLLIYLPLFLVLFFAYNGDSLFFYLKSISVCILATYSGAFLGYWFYSKKKDRLTGSLKIFMVLIPLFFLLFLSIYSYERNSKLNKPLIAELDTIFKHDQKFRTQINNLAEDSIKMSLLVIKMTETDSINLIRIADILDRYGWPGEEIIGWHGASTIWAVIQHSGINVQEKYLTEMRLAVKNGNARSSQLAFLEDRVLMAHGKEQIYGSQITTDSLGVTKPWPIIDERYVNKRRLFAGLGPLQLYAKTFGVKYKLPD
jgi:hypothetical protein